MMKISMKVHAKKIVEEAKSRPLYTMSAADCSSAQRALLGISNAGDCSSASPSLLGSSTAGDCSLTPPALPDGAALSRAL
jgi:hypothetical protein